MEWPGGYRTRGGLARLLGMCWARGGPAQLAPCIVRAPSRAEEIRADGASEGRVTSTVVLGDRLNDRLI